MTFTVTYRAKDGALTDEVVEAASRAECVAECKQREITPMSVREGRVSARPRSGTSAASPSGRNKLRPSRGAKRWRTAILAVLVLAVGVGVWWWLAMRPEPEQRDGQERVAPVRTVKPEARPKPKDFASAASVPVVTNEVASTNKPMTRRERMIAKYGKEPVTVRPGGKYRNGERLPEKRSVFKFASEKEIDRIISAEPGHRIIGRFPKGFIDRDFKKSLEVPIEITAEDTPEEAARKRQMISVKEQLQQAVKRGESLEAILEDARKEVNALADFRDNMIKNLVQLKKSGADPQQIEDYYAAANKMLAEKQIKPLMTPFQIQEKIERLKALREEATP